MSIGGVAHVNREHVSAIHNGCVKVKVSHYMPWRRMGGEEV
jgi:hypothetical protein